jgi:hypothetical protein
MRLSHKGSSFDVATAWAFLLQGACRIGMGQGSFEVFPQPAGVSNNEQSSPGAYDVAGSRARAVLRSPDFSFKARVFFEGRQYASE